MSDFSQIVGNKTDSKLLERKKERQKYEAERKIYQQNRLADEKSKRDFDKSRRITQVNFSSLDSSLDAIGNLISYYCAFCGTFSLVSNKELINMPKRDAKFGGDFVLKTDEVNCQLDVSKGKTLYLKRDEGYERQFLYHCKECNLPICYRTSGFEEDLKVVYVISDSLTDDPMTVAKKIDFYRERSAAKV